MIIHDKIYGNFEIDGVLKELILSPPVQRLKKVHQGGACYLMNEKWNITRYDHSIGVMLLIRKLGGCLEEQIAGLLHDVSHTAFSHVVDYVYENENEDFHERIFDKIIEQSDIPTILSNHGHDYKEILFPMEQWSILEQPLPELCADRIDYTLRDMHSYFNISKDEINKFLNSLIVKEEKICVKSLQSAEWFTETYYKEVIDFFMSPENVYSYHLLSKAIKISLQHKLITSDDLLDDDYTLLSKLTTSNNAEILAILQQINSNVKLELNNTHYDIHGKHKARLIDPAVVINNFIKKASELSTSVAQLNDHAAHKFREGVFIKIV
ncbi:HD domain-containing protein [Cytobacillus sp. IB215316]|uniref:HD domain-containing protein n=1 Tax=Cytobacillus sp. IB215316 TaxID=3097354 RepID=UPI002A0B7D24|nr:HD domain-containing protein [Cytobacillus sp. IB215316]MDX8360807.1 HD domain-containing protein [Cytobacillus sp. IB215316]